MQYQESQWLRFERIVADVERECGNCNVVHNKYVTGHRSKIKRQVDVWLSATVGTHEVTIAIECRCYKHSLGIKDVEAFYGFLDDVGANKGVLISSSGFTSGARKRAQDSTPRETARQTFHVETRFIRLIHHEAEAEGISITDVVNRAFRTYFEKK